MQLSLSRLILIGFTLILIFLNSSARGSEVQEKYDQYIKSWNENITLAKKYMKEGESHLQEGDILISCSSQRKASIYGVAATESLIKAKKLIPDGSYDIERLKEGLEKWKAFGDFCQ